MDAVVVLCHFCEIHGPAVIMCTQPIRQVVFPLPPSRKTSTGATPHASSSCGSFHPASTSASHESTIWPGDQLVHNAFSDLINSAAPPQSTGAVQYTSSTRGQSTSCRACSIITHEELGFVSHDFSAKTDFVSTQFPSDSELLKAVRTACMRSLSSEVMTSEEGPMYFGDDINRHILSYNFYVKDSMARGSQVRFSFLLITWNQIFLMNLWPFVVRCFNTMASRIKSACMSLYEEETASASSSTTAAGNGVNTMAAAASAAVRSATPPAGANTLRLCRTPPPPSSASTLALHQHTASPYNTGPRHSNTTATNSNSSTTPPGRGGGCVGAGGCPAPATLSSSQAVAAGSALSLASQSNSKKIKGLRIMENEVRSLADLCRDEQIYYRVHAWFTWLLRVTSRVWTPVELKSAPLDEDEAFEEEIKNNIYSISNFLVDPSSLTLGAELGWTDGKPDVEAAVQMRLISHLYKCIGDKCFQRLVYYLGTGNQVIVRPLESSKVGAFTAVSLARLLPRGCVRFASESSTYYSTAQCNLLSLTVDAQISKMGSPETPYVILQVNLVPLQTIEVRPMPEEIPQPTDSEASFDQLSFAITFGRALEPISDICDSAWSRSSSLSEGTAPSPWGLTAAGTSAPAAGSAGSAFKKALNSTFAKQITEVFRKVDPQQNSLVVLQPSTIVLALNNIKSKWIDHARTLYSFQHCSKVSSNLDESTKKCFQLLASTAGIAADDEAVVVYFQQALSQQTRQKVCHPLRASPSVPTGGLASARIN